MTVADFQVAEDGVLEFAGAAMDATAQLFFSEASEPAFHLEPGRARRREVEMKARMTQQPTLDGRGFVGGVVIDDQMQLECGRHRLVDGRKELAKLDCPMPLMQLADPGASFEVERREQVSRAVAQIVRRALLGLAGTHRQHWLAAVERLNLRLFIHAQDQRAVGRVEVKEGKQAVAMTRLSCHRFRANEVRLWLSVFAYNLGNLWRRLALPAPIGKWSLTSLQQRLVKKTGGRLIKHARYYWLLLAESHLTPRLFGNMLQKIAALPSPAG